MTHVRHVRPPGRFPRLTFPRDQNWLDVVWLLALRDIRIRYRQTVLGVIWVVLQPLVPALLFAAILGAFAGLPSEGIPYFLFALTGLVAWNATADGVTRASASVVSKQQLVTKVYLPRILLPFASVVSTIPDIVVGIVLILTLALISGVPLTLSIIALPFFVLLALVIAFGVGLWLSALNVYYRDVGYALPFVIQTWLFASPVLYSMSLIPDWLRPLYLLNPMVGVIEGFRWSLLGGGELPIAAIVTSIIGALVLLVTGFLGFRKLEMSFADAI